MLCPSVCSIRIHPPTHHFRTQSNRLTDHRRVFLSSSNYHHDHDDDDDDDSIPEQIGRECEKAAKGIFPLSVVLIRKVKVLKKPKFDRKFPSRLLPPAAAHPNKHPSYVSLASAPSAPSEPLGPTPPRPTIPTHPTPLQSSS